MQKERAAGAPARLAAIVSVLVIIGATLWRAFGGPPGLFIVIIAAIAVLVVSQFRQIPANLRNTSLILLVIAVALLPLARSPLAALQRGVFISGLLLGLMGSVMLLARCALRNPSVHVIGQALRAQPGGRRYAAFTVAGQVFAAMLGMAGANIMLIMAAPQNEPAGERKTAAVVAVTRGFTAASYWSPMFGNMAILLALYPTLRWIEVFPIGVLMAQLTLPVGMLLHRLRQRGAPPEPPGEAVPPGFARAAVPLALLMLAFLGLVLLTGSRAHISTTASIVLLGPCVALLLNIAMAERGRRVPDGVRRLVEDLRLYPNLASEALLFLGAGCAGSILGDAFPASWVARIGEAVHGMPLFGIAFLLAAVMGAALTGIHPVLTAVFLASTITPQVLDLPPMLHILAILSGWGLSASLTPYSVLSLTASRYAGTGLYQISLGRNALFALFNAVCACLLLTAVAMWMRM
ncbi:hypothetical protein [Noviherbaspirillum aridicola]|uniref:H+/gluconate symporter-like permease n=1 Tax=Noviherbaspirillum aridicola TaxID=2849687 RepID=A0ABQ4Q002_9BURK|nr:hypothetical protein [Noviherbaspirillum aridicola]GIZ50396.1 hypothetical protein NCCP691_04100 [Noviherbaspirillum aridicola]